MAPFPDQILTMIHQTTSQPFPNRPWSDVQSVYFSKLRIEYQKTGYLSFYVF